MVIELLKIVCVKTIGDSFVKDGYLNKQYCSDIVNSLSNQLILENNTLYVLDHLVNTIRRIIYLTNSNTGRNIDFRIKNRRTAGLIKNNPFEKITKSIETIAVYIYDKNINSFETIYIDLDIDDYLYIIFSLFPKPLYNLFSKNIGLIKFTIVGFTGFLVNLITLYVSTNLYSKLASYEFATMLGSITSFETSLLWNFLLHEYWTFRDRGLKHDKVNLVIRWIKYHIGSIISLFSQVSIVTTLSGYLHYPLYLSLIIGVLTGYISNYVFSSKITWRR